MAITYQDIISAAGVTPKEKTTPATYSEAAYNNLMFQKMLQVQMWIMIIQMSIPIRFL